MTSKNYTKVVIFGGLPGTSKRNERADQFRNGCREMGRALAEAGCTIVVCSDRAGTADRHVVEGADQFAPGTPIVAFRNVGQAGSGFDFCSEATRLNMIVEHAAIAGLRTKEQALKYSDAAILIGGGSGTNDAAVAARGLHVRLVPLASFGGAGADVLKDMRTDGLIDENDAMLLSAPWVRERSARRIVELATSLDRIAAHDQRVSNASSHRPTLSMRRTGTMIVQPLFGVPRPLAVQETCDIFVLMPFRDDLKPVYGDHITKVATDLDLSVKRGDDFFTAHSVMIDVWAAICSARIVIADCTGRNPNVFYEMGIAHTVGKPVILITQNKDDVPFDLRHIRYIEYEMTPRGAQKFEATLKSTIVQLVAVSREGPDASNDPSAFDVDLPEEHAVSIATSVTWNQVCSDPTVNPRPWTVGPDGVDLEIDAPYIGMRLAAYYCWNTKPQQLPLHIAFRCEFYRLQRGLPVHPELRLVLFGRSPSETYASTPQLLLHIPWELRDELYGAVVGAGKAQPVGPRETESSIGWGDIMECEISVGRSIAVSVNGQEKLIIQTADVSAARVVTDGNWYWGFSTVGGHLRILEWTITNA